MRISSPEQSSERTSASNPYPSPPFSFGGNMDQFMKLQLGNDYNGCRAPCGRVD